jgi:hypothetical protein
MLLFILAQTSCINPYACPLHNTGTDQIYNTVYLHCCIHGFCKNTNNIHGLIHGTWIKLITIYYDINNNTFYYINVEIFLQVPNTIAIFSKLIISILVAQICVLSKEHISPHSYNLKFLELEAEILI